MQFGFDGRTVLLTFGLLSPSKGIETVIDAMPGIIRSCPNALYVVLGATHPNLVRDQGEVYRESLAARVRELGIEDHVVFFNQFVEQSTLLDFISMCDVYVTPYLNEAQMTSGTLAYSFGLGKAVVSTPYWHASELLADGRGILVPFGDAAAMGTRNCGSADQRRPPPRHAQASLCGQPIDDVGPDRQALCRRLRGAIAWPARAAGAAQRSDGAGQPLAQGSGAPRDAD